jgi:predicted cobalt transporter CbtA
MAAEAAVFADEAASIAAVAAVPADIAAEAAAPESGVVTTVVEVDGVVVVAGGVIVVVDSSFLLHAANETAAARVTINNAVFMFLLDFKFGQLPVIVGTLFWSKSPIVCKTWKARAFQCLTDDYRRLRCFP